MKSYVEKDYFCKDKEIKQNDKKKLQEKEKNKIDYKLYFTQNDKEIKECKEYDFIEFQKQYPEIAQLLMNPELIEKIPNLLDLIEKNNWKKNAMKIINNLWKIKSSSIFHQPVDVEQFDIPDYYEIVKHPIDFGTIKRKLCVNLYESPDQFVNDMEQVFSNCILFNQEDSQYG